MGLLMTAFLMVWIVNTAIGTSPEGTCNQDRPVNTQKSEIKHYNIILLGATGNLATKYLWRSLFDVFRRQYVKETTRFMFYAASRREPEDGRRAMSRLLLSLNCDDDTECIELKQRFIESMQFQRLKTERDFQTLADKLYENTQSVYGFDPGTPVTYEAGRLIYMAIPPSTYPTTAKYVHQYLRPKIGRPWFRVVLEKPFGTDLESAHSLLTELAEYFDESEVYRIDHYLGKTAVKEILPFRYINRDVLEPLWNRNYIDQVEIVMKEREDVASRLSFYDDVGVIRDVMQNHLTELLSLVALDLPADSGNITSLLRSKVRVLRDLKPPTDRSVLLGQYSTYNHEKFQDLQNKMTNASQTPTFAAAVVFVNNRRWRDVPFLLVSGKKLDEKTSYIRVRFRDGRFCIRASFAHDEASCVWRRQIVFRIGSGAETPSMIAVSQGLPRTKPPRSGWNDRTKQTSTVDAAPNEMIFGQSSDEMTRYFADTESDPYMDLIEAVMDGSRHLFVPTDFVLASWRYWTSAIALTDGWEPRKYLGHGKDSERLDFFVARTGSSFGLQYWLNERNVLHHDILLSSSVAAIAGQSLPKITQIPVTFRNTTLRSGNPKDLVAQLVDDISKAAYDRTATADGEFHLALSGGKTSETLFDDLAESSISWERVHIWQVDERCADGSNFELIQQRLLSKIRGLRHRNVHPMPIDIADEPCSEGSLVRGDRVYDELIRRYVPDNAFDYVVLGVGPDGHTASLFPGQASVDENEHLVVFSGIGNASDTDPSNRRMTLTLPALNAARKVAFLVTGSQKHSILRDISKTADDAVSQYPAVGVKSTRGSLTWYVDFSAMTGEDSNE